MKNYLLYWEKQTKAEFEARNQRKLTSLVADIKEAKAFVKFAKPKVKETQLAIEEVIRDTPRADIAIRKGLEAVFEFYVDGNFLYDDLELAYESLVMTKPAKLSKQVYEAKTALALFVNDIDNWVDATFNPNTTKPESPTFQSKKQRSK
jgi:hypothetical protein